MLKRDVDSSHVPGFDHYTLWKDGYIVRETNGKSFVVRGSTPGRSTTPQVRLTNSRDQNSRRVMLSRLMLEVWPKPYPLHFEPDVDDLVASFYDRNGANCSWDNLYWSTKRNVARLRYLGNDRMDFDYYACKIINIETDFTISFPNVISCAKHVGRDPIEVLDLTDEQHDDGDWQYLWC